MELEESVDHQLEQLPVPRGGRPPARIEITSQMAIWLLGLSRTENQINDRLRAMAKAALDRPSTPGSADLR
jgi:hypothetical protein